LNSSINDRSVLRNSQDYILNVMKKNSLDVLELGNSSGKVHYRFHRPADFGDDKSKQKIIQEALSGKTASSLEVGHSGLGLRMCAPLKNSGTLMVGQVVNNEFVSQLTGGKNVHIALFQKQRLLAFSDPLVDDFIKNSPDKDRNNFRSSWKNGNYYLKKIPYENTGIGPTDIDFLILIDETDLESSTRKIWGTFAFTATLIFSGIFLISFLFSRDIVQAVKSLTFAMKNPEKDEKEILDLDRRDEIGQIGFVYINMKSELLKHQNHLEELVEEKTGQLQESNTKLKSTLDELHIKQKIINHEMQIAKELQNYLLPSAKNFSKELDVSTLFLPASGVSGDIYDFGQISDHEFFFFLADVSGHGVPAALVTTMVKTSLGSINIRKHSPAEILRKLNKELLASMNEHYFTAIFCLVNTKKEKVFFANAGSTPAIVVRKEKEKSILLTSTGTILGVMDDPELVDKAANFYNGDKLFLFSDGLSEERNSSREEFGISTINKIIWKNKEKSSEKIIGIILDSLLQFSENKAFKDDVTCVLVG
ncbi:MAG: SpoIIE family protein phosphatase, partial [Leptospira sp.]|nr:SpoIIE family protein phosphatase [Leptospira sp.]